MKEEQSKFLCKYGSRKYPLSHCHILVPSRYKQRGKAAEEADNVFHHLTYDGASLSAAGAGTRERSALELQVTRSPLLNSI